MAHHTDVMLRLFEAVGARSVVEIGAYAGDLTRVLVQWADQTGGGVGEPGGLGQPAGRGGKHGQRARAECRACSASTRPR